MSSDKEEQCTKQNPESHHPEIRSSSDPRGAVAMMAGGLGALAGYAATEYELNKRLLPFDTQVANKTVEQIRGMGLTGGLASGGGVLTDGSGIAGGVLKERAYLNMLNENNLARTLHNIGGRKTLSYGVALITGIIGLVVGLSFFGGFKKKEQKLPLAVGDDTSTHKEKIIAEEKMPTKHELTVMEQELEKKKAMVAKWEDKMSARKESAEHAASPSLSA